MHQPDQLTITRPDGTLAVAPEFFIFLIDQSYRDIRVLPDGAVAALFPLMFTTAICTGITWNSSFSHRWCFEDPKVAREQLALMKAEDQEPKGYKARRGGYYQRRVAL